MDCFNMSEVTSEYPFEHHLPFDQWSTIDLSNNNDFSESFISPSIISQEKPTQYQVNTTSPFKPRRKRKKTLHMFICNECYKVYNSKENMLLHYKNIHLKQKPYECSYCSAGFSHRNGKIYHERKFHTKIFPYVCPYIDNCNLTFPTKSSLKYHLKSKH